MKEGSSFHKNHLSKDSILKIMNWPKEYWVYDFSLENPVACRWGIRKNILGSKLYCKKKILSEVQGLEFSVGKYNEVRPYLYPQETYGDRKVHMGLDLGISKGTPLFTFYDGHIYDLGFDKKGYGFFVFYQFVWKKKKLWALWGHLSEESMKLFTKGDSISAGSFLGSIGDFHQNGGWFSHLHLQISVKEPVRGVEDFPGVVSINDTKKALKRFRDPQKYIGVTIQSLYSKISQ